MGLRYRAITKSFIVALMIISFVAPTLSHAQPDENACRGDPMRYVVAFQAPDIFTVEVEFQTASHRFQMPVMSSPSEENGSAAFISGVTLSGESGDILPVDSGGLWEFPEPDDATVYEHLSYRVTAQHDRAEWPPGKEEVAYKFDNAFYFTGQAFFVVDYPAWNSCAFQIEFRLPEEWSVVAPWREVAQNTFNVQSRLNLHRNAFLVGPNLKPYRTQTKSGAIELITVFEEELEPLARDANSLLSETLEAYSEIFGGAPVDRYAAFFGVGAFTDGGSFGQSFGQRFALPVLEHESIVWKQVLAHEMAHLWLGNSYRPDDHVNQAWFTEGATDYITTKALYRIGVIDEAELEIRLANYVRKYLIGRRFTSSDMSLADAAHNKHENRLLVYGSGSLFALMLDSDMAASGAPRGFEYALRKLYQDSSEPYSVERLMAVLDEESNGEASRIYDLLNSEFNWIADFPKLSAYLNKGGLATSIWPPDEVYIYLNAEPHCLDRKHRSARCAPKFLRR